MKELERFDFVKMMDGLYVKYLNDGTMLEVKNVGGGFRYREFQVFYGDLCLAKTKEFDTLNEIIDLVFMASLRTAS